MSRFGVFVDCRFGTTVAEVRRRCRINQVVEISLFLSLPLRCRRQPNLFFLLDVDLHLILRTSFTSHVCVFGFLGFFCDCFCFHCFHVIAEVIEVLSLLLILQIIEKCFEDQLKMHFICLLICQDEPGKQVKSAIRIKNISKSHIAFKVRVSISFFNSQT